MRTIAIDGPSGSGKSTVARSLARRLGLPHVDTGAMYRAVTLKALRLHIAPGDQDRIARMIDESEIRLDGPVVLLDGEDVAEAIRAAAVTAAVSQIAAHQAVRSRLVPLQRALARKGGVVEGRDIGTVVLPDAGIKIFLTAAPTERGRRRWEEERSGDLEKTIADLGTRDQMDSERNASPLLKAEDAVVLDTTEMTADEAVDWIVALIESRA